MAEPYAFLIRSETDFDGVTTIDATRDDFALTGGRQYTVDISGGGVVPADIFGFMSPVSPKLVGVAAKNSNPQSAARVLSNPDSTLVIREEFDITPRMQHFALFAGDRVAIVTQDGGRTEVQLVVNEMSEEEHVRYALAHGRAAAFRRFRIIRTAGSGFVANFNTIWQPTFTWDEATNLMVAEENAEGAIPVRSLCLHPRFHGCFVSVRYANVDNNGRVHTRDPVVGAHAQLDQIPNMIWSKVLYFSHDDMIVLESQGPESGSTVIADIEIVGAAPIDRMRGRYTQGA